MGDEEPCNLLPLTTPEGRNCIYKDCANIETADGNYWDCSEGAKEKQLLRKKEKTLEEEETKLREKIDSNKSKCEEIGFKKGTKKFKNCVVELM
ncbi:hypothetical protein OAJ43_00505 [Nitrosomonadales bacterium]|nr:hypothetical protein [Nitrosomonadales bacterium]